MLRYKADRRTLLFVGFYFALLVFTWVLAPPEWYIALPLILGLCVFSWICAIMTHNTIHAPIFHSKPLNKAFQVVLTLTYGHPVSSYVSGHNLSHHRHTQKGKDVMRTTKMRFKSNFLNMLLFFPAVGKTITRGDVQFAKTMRKQRPKWFRQMLIELIALVALSVVLLVIDWKKFLLYFYLPHMYAAWGIITINYLQHDGCDEDHGYNHSRNFVGRVFNWFVFNNGFHGIHHIKPSLHWSKLREVHDRDVKPHLHPALDQPSILLYAFRAFIWPGQRVTFEGDPVVLPEKAEDVPWIPGLTVKQVEGQLGAG